MIILHAFVLILILKTIWVVTVFDLNNNNENNN